MTNGGVNTPQDARFDISGTNYGWNTGYGFFENDVYVCDEILPGEYTVTETDAAVEGYKLEVTYSPRTFTLSEDNPSQKVTITNTYTKRNPGARTYKVTYAYEGPCPAGAQLPVRRNTKKARAWTWKPRRALKDAPSPAGRPRMSK